MCSNLSLPILRPQISPPSPLTPRTWLMMALQLPAESRSCLGHVSFAPRFSASWKSYSPLLPAWLTVMSPRQAGCRRATVHEPAANGESLSRASAATQSSHSAVPQVPGIVGHQDTLRCRTKSKEVPQVVV